MRWRSSPARVSLSGGPAMSTHGDPARAAGAARAVVARSVETAAATRVRHVRHDLTETG